MKKRLPCVLAVLLLLAGLFSVATAYGTEVAVNLNCGESIVQGASFSARLSYAGDVFRSATVEVTYDPEVLEFKSCIGGDGFAEDGTVRILLSEEEGTDSLSCKVRFLALKEGESFITVTTSSLTNLDGMELTGETRSVKVMVKKSSVKATATVSSDNSVETDDHDEGDDEARSNSQIRSAETLESFFMGLSVTEFVLIALCLTVILLLLILLAAERGRRKK